MALLVVEMGWWCAILPAMVQPSGPNLGRSEFADMFIARDKSKARVDDVWVDHTYHDALKKLERPPAMSRLVGPPFPKLAFVIESPATDSRNCR